MSWITAKYIVVDVINARGCKPLFMPSYSPFLNAIEECWSKTKKNIRRNPLKKGDELIPRITSVDQVKVKKIGINGLSKDYKFLKWAEASLQRSPSRLEYFSFAEQFDGTEEATNTSYKDLLLTLQSHQSNKLTSIAHSAEIAFNVYAY